MVSEVPLCRVPEIFKNSTEYDSDYCFQSNLKPILLKVSIKLNYLILKEICLTHAQKISNTNDNDE